MRIVILETAAVDGAVVACGGRAGVRNKGRGGGAVGGGGLGQRTSWLEGRTGSSLCVCVCVFVCVCV